MLERWLHSEAWTHEQWLIASILGFIVVATLVVVYRVFTIIASTRKKRERPRLRPGRRFRR